MHDYFAYGLNFRCDFPLPELSPARGAPEVFVRCASLAQPWEDPARGERSFQKTPAGILLTWSRYARFLVSDGREIICEPAPGNSDEAVIRHLLMGPVFSILSYQLGTAIFHASAVALASGGVAFMARAGYGKSTQAAAMVQRGAPLITDDLLLLQVVEQKVTALPGVPYLKLWPSSMAMIGEDPADHPLVKTNLEKRSLNMGATVMSGTVPMRAIYLLEPGPSLEIQQLSKTEALRRIMPHWYGALFQGELLPVLGLERHFLDCTAIVERIPVYLLKRPPSMDLIPEICQAIECQV
jgi:hypothetical protein